MPIESKQDSFKKKVNRKSHQSKVKYLNSRRLKNVKNTKESKSINYISGKNHIGNNRYKVPIRTANNTNVSRQGGNKLRTHTLVGNVSSNLKDPLRENDDRQSDTGIQAVIYASDKIDAAVDVVYRSKKVVRAVKGVKSITNSLQEKKSIDKMLLKRLALKATKSTMRTAKNINTQISSRLQSEDTDLGMRSFAAAEEKVRKTYDTSVAVKSTSVDAYKFVSTARNKSNGVKDKIYSEKASRYSSYKRNIQKSERTRSRRNINAGSCNKTAAYRPAKIKTNRVISSKVANYRSASIITNASKSIVGVAKKAVMLILPGKKILILILVCASALFLFINSASSSVISALSQQYFMADNSAAENYMDKAELLDNELLKEIKDLADDDRYDDVRIDYIGDMQGIHTNFQEIFAVAAVNFEQDITYSSKEESFIEDIYKYMYDIKISSERYYVYDDNDEEIEMRRKIITVYAYDMDTVMSKIRFDEEQKSWARRLVSGFNEQFPEFAQRYGELTEDEIKELIKNAPQLSSENQKKLYDTALSIVGKVKYFWGGKSSAGWNDEWGKSRLVTSPGSDTTDTYRPFGLDCSGYVDWVYKTAGIGNMLSGGGTAYQFGQSYPIKADDLQVGDLAFLQMPNSSGINHVGIYIGKDKDNNNIYAHCEWSTGTTVNGFKGFKYFRRVVNFEQE